jgi:hypothetical protein
MRARSQERKFGAYVSSKVFPYGKRSSNLKDDEKGQASHSRGQIFDHKVSDKKSVN